MRRQRVNELAPPVGGRSPARKAHECARTKTTLFCILREECDESVALAPFLLAHVREWPVAPCGVDMSRRKNGPDLDSKLLAAIRALAEANASLPEVIVLAANETATRTDWAIRQEKPFRMEEGCGFVMKVRLGRADET
jgi:hypothetical protein